VADLKLGRRRNAAASDQLSPYPIDRREMRVGCREKHAAIAPMKYGDETKLLNASIPIVERLHCWVNGKSFSIKNSQEIDQENAEALWSGCKFSNLH
jgi:hypothetical protein